MPGAARPRAPCTLRVRPAVQRGSAVAVIRAAARQAGVPVREACKELTGRLGQPS